MEAARRSWTGITTCSARKISSSSSSSTICPTWRQINRNLMELGPHYQARYVATNDAHYINPEDAKYQDILLAIQTGALLTDPDRMRMTDASYYLRSPEEMARLFAEVPEVALEHPADRRTLQCRTWMSRTTTCRCSRCRKGRPPRPTCACCAMRAPNALRGRADSEAGPDPPRLRVGRHPQDGLRCLLPDRLGLVPLRPRTGHLVQRPRLGGRFDRRLHPGHHPGGPDPATSCSSSAS